MTAGCPQRSFHGVSVPLGPAIVLHPSFALGMSALRQKMPNPKAINVSERSTLIVRGPGVSNVIVHRRVTAA